MSAPLTAQGTILGTFQYMAPEQVEGLEADARTDIFAFGAVLYEMLTGRKAFEGKSQASLIGAILEREPAPVASLQPATPRVAGPRRPNVPGEGSGESLPQRARSARSAEMDSRPGISSGVAIAPVTRGRSRNRLLTAASVTLLVATVTGVAVWRLKPERSQTDQTVCDRAARKVTCSRQSTVTSWRFRRTGRDSCTSPTNGCTCG